MGRAGLAAIPTPHINKMETVNVRNEIFKCRITAPLANRNKTAKVIYRDDTGHLNSDFALDTSEITGNILGDPDGVKAAPVMPE
jgi:hypothetical protein